MKKSGPVLANVMLNGILPENLTVPDTHEPVQQYDRKPTHPVRGWVFVDGAAAGGATIAFHTPGADGRRPRFVGDAIVEGDGSFVMSSYGAFDRVPVGEYLVTVAFDGRYGQLKDRQDWVPAAYTRPDTTPLRANVKAGKNEVTLELRSDAAGPADKK